MRNLNHLLLTLPLCNTQADFLFQNATFDVKNYFVVLGKPIEFIHFHNPVCVRQRSPAPSLPSEFVFYKCSVWC